MSHYSIEDLIARWRREELTADQLLGQLLLVLREHDQRLKELGRATQAAQSAPAAKEPKEEQSLRRSS